MKKRLTATRQNPALFWVEMNHPLTGWRLAHPHPMSREQGEEVMRKAEPGITRDPGFPFVRKARMYLDEIDMMDEELKGKLTGPRRSRIMERRRMLILYTLDILRSM